VAPEPAVAVLVFELGSTRFGLDASSLLEVVRAVAIAPLPQGPPIVEGVVNYRGSIVPVLDIRDRFGLPGAPLRTDQCFLVARAGQRTVALRVDRATELTTVSASSIQPACVSVPDAGYTAGIATLPDGLLIITDLDRFLSLDESERLDAAVDRISGVLVIERPIRSP